MEFSPFNLDLENRRLENLLDFVYRYRKYGLDGCSGYCPGCFQRPWCDTRESSCWTEDEEAGKMSLIEALNPYLSASPQSLKILQRLQAEQDADAAKFDAENPASGFELSTLGEDWKARLN